MLRRGLVLVVLMALMVLGLQSVTQSPVAAAPVLEGREPSGRGVPIIIYFEDSYNQGAENIRGRGGKIKHVYHIIPAIAATVPKSALRGLERDENVKRIEPDFLLYADPGPPNDPKYSDLWGLNNTGQTGGTQDADIDAPEAWEFTTGNSNVVIAVIDTGAQVAPGVTGKVSTHPDLAANLWTNPGEIAGNGIDDDGNGYVDDIHGWNFFDDASWLFWSSSEDSHGTHVAGTIAAVGNNDTGVVGVNWQAQVMVLKFIGPLGGYTSDAIAAIEYARDKDAKVINASWGSEEFSLSLKKAIEACNCLFNAAAGNSGVNTDENPHYPSGYNSPNLISVAATDHNDELASFSNFGATLVDLGAPGVSIRSTLPISTYGSFSGTSMATPHVTGAAALILSAPGQDSLTVAQLKSAILDNVDPISSLAGKTVTGGRLNVCKAIPGCAAPPPPVVISPTSDTVVVGGQIAYGATGSMTPFHFSIMVNDSGGGINPTTGLYNAGTTSGVTDTVRVTDADLNTADATVTVVAALAISPASETVASGSGHTFSATGGVGGNNFSIPTNKSGGSINPTTGLYAAGPTSGVVDTVQVTDADGNTADATVTVVAALAISPTSDTVVIGGQITFSATGGVGGNSFSIPTNNSGGTINSAGLYTAGATSTVVDTVRVTDADLNTADATVTVEEIDTIPPDAVSDLGVSAYGASSLTLTWTATADDANDPASGAASSYDVRYSTSSIETAEDWAAAAQAAGEPTPQPSGSEESFKISGLLPSTLYYTALKVGDNLGNESVMSNVAFGSTAALIFQDDMESGPGGWDATGLWNQDTFRSVSPVYAWYYGQPAKRNYNTGAANSGTLTSPQIDLTGATEARLTFQEWIDVEDDVSPKCPEIILGESWDCATVQVSTTNGATWETLTQSYDNYPNPNWVERTADLTPYVGKTIYIRFWFDTVDYKFNSFEGWYIDDVEVTADMPGSPPPSNAAPVANAGADQTVGEGDPVTLDGTGSTDADGDPLSYSWTQTAGPGVTLSGPTSAIPSFTSPAVTAATVLTFQLMVNDGTATDTDGVNVTVQNNVNEAPTANAGLDQSVTEGDPVALDGAGSSDPNGDPLSYSWTQTAGPGVTLSGATSSTPSFTAPDVTAATVLTFQLMVSDGTANDTDSVNVTVQNNVNEPPVANAGLDQSVMEGDPVALDGTASSDPNGDPLSYSWAQTAGPGVTLSDPASDTPSFASPAVTATKVLTFELMVSDGTATHTDSVDVTVQNNVNEPPIADAGADQTVGEGDLVTLNGTGSTDPNGDTLTYSWTQTAGQTVTLNGATSATPSFTAPDVTAETDLTFQLMVSDGTANDTDSVIVTVQNNVNEPPVANAGLDQSVTQGVMVGLDGTGSSDPNGDPFSYSWTQTAGPVVTLSGPTSATPSFTAPDVTAATDLTFQLTVNDGTLSSSDTTTVTVNYSGPPAPDTMHVANLDGASAKMPKGHWKAFVTIMVYDNAGTMVANAIVHGTFTQDGSPLKSFSCTTVDDGTCIIDSGQFPNKSGSATFTVDYVTHATLTYDSSANHDPDGDSDGTTIELSK